MKYSPQINVHAVMVATDLIKNLNATAMTAILTLRSKIVPLHLNMVTSIHTEFKFSKLHFSTNRVQILKTVMKQNFTIYHT
jgi:hypothetical protein